MKKILLLCCCIAFIYISPAEVVDITVFHTTDLHGKFIPVTDYEGNENVGGIASLSPVLEKQRAKYPDSLLLDNGDTYQGTLASRMTDGLSVITWMNAQKYDAWNLGNHEYDWGVETLEKNINAFSGAVVSANCLWAGDGTSPLEKVKPYIIKEIKGVRVAIIGVNHPKVPFWTRQNLLQGAVVEQPVTALLRVMPAVRAEKPDAIILLAHMGYNDESNTLEKWLKETLDMFPDIDVVIGGHTHRPVPALRFNNTLYTQAGYHGITLGKIHIICDSDTGEIYKKKAKLIPIEGAVKDVPEDAVFADAIHTAAALLTQEICTINGVIGGDKLYESESPEQTLLCEAIADAVDADIVFHGSFRSPVCVSNRVMTYKDLYALVPYENHIVVAHLTADEIAKVLDELMEWWGTYRFAFPYGIVARIDADGLAGERVIALHTLNGNPLNPTNRYRVAFNSYMAASGGNRHPGVRALIDSIPAHCEDTDMQTRDIVENYLKKIKEYTPHVTETLDVIKEQRQPYNPVTSSTPRVPGPIRFIAFAFMHPGTRSQEQASEWFAVQNMSEEPVNLKGYRLSDGDEGGTFLIKNDLILAPGEKLVFCHTPQYFREKPYGKNPYLRLFGYGELAGRLNLGNRGDELMMIDSQGRLADQITYGQHIEEWPSWPAESKAPNHKPGEALEKTEGGWQVTENPLRSW